MAFDTVLMTAVALYGMWADVSFLTVFSAVSVTTALLLSSTGYVGGSKKKLE